MDPKVTQLCFCVPSLYFRGCPCAFSTAAQQRSTGDECGPEDPSEEPKHPLSDCALEHKAIKLEEQVRDLTVSVLHAFASVPLAWSGFQPWIFP